MKKETKTTRLKKLEENLKVTKKSREYLETELFKIKEREVRINEKIGKEKQAMALTNKAKKLRYSGLK